MYNLLRDSIGGALSNRKGVNTPTIVLPISPMTPKDRVYVLLNTCSLLIIVFFKIVYYRYINFFWSIQVLHLSMSYVSHTAPTSLLLPLFPFQWLGVCPHPLHWLGCSILCSKARRHYRTSRSCWTQGQGRFQISDICFIFIKIFSILSFFSVLCSLFSFSFFLFLFPLSYSLYPSFISPVPLCLSSLLLNPPFLFLCPCFTMIAVDGQVRETFSNRLLGRGKGLQTIL